MTFRKGQVFKANTNIPVGKSAVAVPAGTIFFCQRGGANPQLVYALPDHEGLLVITAPANLMAAMLSPVGKEQLPPRLASHFGISTPSNPIPTFRKGEFAKLTETVDLGDGVVLPTDHIVRCEKGGKSPRFLARDPNGKLWEVTLDASVLAPSEGIKDAAAMNRLSTRIKTFPAMSEETIALRGEIRLGAHRITVANDGTGGLTYYHGSREATQAVTAVLDDALRESGMSTKDGEDLIEEYVDHYISTHGILRFADYLKDKRRIAARLAVH